MQNIAGIHSLSVDEKTISLLEDLLEKARLGDLRSLMYVDKYKDSTLGCGWSGSPDVDMLGKFLELQHMYLTELAQTEPDPFDNNP